MDPTIRVGEYCFNALTPFDFLINHLPARGGLYVFLILDPKNGFRVIYIGETKDYRERLTKQHHKYALCRLKAGGLGLFLAICPLPYATEVERKRAESRLIQTVQPEYNDQCVERVA